MLPIKFYIDDNNLCLNAAYQNDNYKILNGIRGDICFIFCSGNGVYFPNELEVFEETIICNDRYEWAHVATGMVHYVKKIIFIRDVRKNFYVTGINHKINCIDKLIDFLRCEWGGKTVVVGNSAGGYLASIIGAKLHAMAIFNFSGQWNLYEAGSVVSDYYYLSRFADREMYNKYFDISKLVEDSGVPVFYFYAQKCRQDIAQTSHIRNTSNVYTFTFDSDQHGVGLTTTESYINLFMSDYEMLKKLSDSYRDIPLKPDDMSRLFNELFLCEAAFGYVDEIEKAQVKKIINRQRLSDKHLALFKMMNQWVKIKQEGKNLASYFVKKGYNMIAIYGMSYAGQTLIRELEGTNVRTVYGIDKNVTSITACIDVFTMEDALAEVDVVVVTAITFFNEISVKLMNKLNCPVISLESILYEI